MSNVRWFVSLGWLTIAGIAAAWGQDVSRMEMQSLDEQVQEIKSDVLSIAAELSGLEERLLYPSNTQVSVFVSLANSAPFRLDAVQIHINGQLATHYIYSYKELEALEKGGVQRVYTGNLPTGRHALEVTVAGKLQSGRDFTESASFSFTKDVEPRLLGLTLAAPGSAAGVVSMGDW
jgi:hypothetical protein